MISPVSEAMVSVGGLVLLRPDGGPATSVGLLEAVAVTVPRQDASVPPAAAVVAGSGRATSGNAFPSRAVSETVEGTDR